MKVFNTRLDLAQAFDRLTIGTVTILSFVILMLLMVLVLYSRLQTASVDNNYELLEKVNELQETTDDLQNTLGIMNLLPSEGSVFSGELDNIERRLDEIDETLEIIEDNIEEITPPEEDTADIDDVPPSTQEIEDIHQIAGRIFLFVAYLIGGLSIATAIVLLSAVGQRRKSRNSLNRDIAFPVE